MYSESLFLGFKLDSGMELMLSKADPAIRNLFCSGGDYLKEWEEQGQKYLGKVISAVVDIPTLDLLKSNILSLKQRLLPDHSEKPIPLWLIAIIQKNS